MSAPEGAARVAPAVAEAGGEAVRRRADPRLPAYLVAGLGALIAAIATGHPELAALGAPFVVLLAAALVPREPGGLMGQVSVHADRAIEGDLVEGAVAVDWEGEAEVDVLLSGWRGVDPVEPEGVIGWSLPLGRGPVTLPFTLRARSWGAHDLGALWVRARRPGSFLVTERVVARAPTLRVLPGGLRLDRLLRPAEPRAIAGMHISRFRGQGIDFAELRPYRPGDRLRDLSWGTSARLGTPWVTVRHPERTGTVLLFLDAVFSGEPRSMEALARVARAAWALASVHLRAQDRVGLLAQGRTTAWLPPRGGRRARWLLLDELLSVGQAAEDLSRRRRRGSRSVVPSDALVVGVTTLRSQTFAPELMRYRRAGHTTVALVVDTTDLVAASSDRVDDAVRRIRLAQREAERHALHRGGVPTALVSGAEGVGAAVLTLRRRMDGLQQPTRSRAAAR